MNGNTKVSTTTNNIGTGANSRLKCHKTLKPIAKHSNRVIPNHSNHSCSVATKHFANPKLRSSLSLS